AHAVDELRLLAIHAGDGLGRDDPGSEAVRRPGTHATEDGVAGGVDLGLFVVVDLEQAVGPLDDLHAGLDRRGLESGVGQLVDGDARGDLDEERGLAFEGHEALADGLQEAGDLGLQVVEDGKRAQLHGNRHGMPRPSRLSTRPVPGLVPTTPIGYGSSRSTPWRSMVVDVAVVWSWRLRTRSSCAS